MPRADAAEAPATPSAGPDGIEAQLDLFVAFYSTWQAGRCALDEPGREQYGLFSSMALVAARRLQLGGKTTLAAATQRLLRGPHFYGGGDGGGTEVWEALLGVLTGLGVDGLKTYVRFDLGMQPVTGSSDEDLRFVPVGPELNASDDTWIQFLRSDQGKKDASPLLWFLARDQEVLSQLQGDVDSTVNADLVSEGYPDVVMSILVIAPAEGGVSDAKLREWSRGGNWETVRWGADLALARRGDGDAQGRLRETMQTRFKLRPREAKASEGCVPWERDGGQFDFVIELAGTPLADRWDLLLDLLQDHQPRLLAPRAAALLALEEHWAELDAKTQDKVRTTVAAVQWAEPNEWLRSLMIMLLASHPHAGRGTGLAPDGTE